VAVAPDELDVGALSAEFEQTEASRIVAWAVEMFGPHVAVSSSFGADSAVMLHLATSVQPDIKVVTIDTGFLFPETIAFREELRRRLGLNLYVYRPRLTAEEFVATHGAMWRSNPDACCGFNKREPFQRAKRELKTARLADRHPPRPVAGAAVHPFRPARRGRAGQDLPDRRLNGQGRPPLPDPSQPAPSPPA